MSRNCVWREIQILQCLTDSLEVETMSYFMPRRKTAAIHSTLTVINL